MICEIIKRAVCLPELQKRVWAFLLVIFDALLLNLLSVLIPFPVVADDSATTLLTANVGEVISLTLPETIEIVLDTTSGDVFASESGTVNVVTNSTNGYTLFATPSSSNLVNSAASATLPSIPEVQSESDFESGHWGIYIGSDFTGTFSPVTTSKQTIAVTDEANGSTGGDDYTLAVGAKASSLQPAGEYIGSITFQAVVNVAPGMTTYSFPDHYADSALAAAYGAANSELAYVGGYKLYTLQGMTSSICAGAADPDDLTSADSIQVVDTRDGKIYWISKLKDGNCWMTQNLDLDLSNTEALTSEKSNVSDDWTPSSSTVSGTGNANDYADSSTSALSGVCSGFSSNNNTPYSCDNGDYYYEVSISGTTVSGTKTDLTDTSGDGYLTTSNAVDNENLHYHVGNFYNWSAAIASNASSTYSSSSTTVQTSICPANWVLPTGTDSGDYYNLTHGTYGYESSVAGSASISGAPFYALRPGYASSGSLLLSGYYGGLWTATPRNASNAYDANWHPSKIDPGTGYDGRSGGHGVRCMVRTES